MSPPIRVAIVGAGPGGLAAAILLGQVEGVEVALYDKARELREVGAVSIIEAGNPVLTNRASRSTKTPGGC